MKYFKFIKSIKTKQNWKRKKKKVERKIWAFLKKSFFWKKLPKSDFDKTFFNFKFDGIRAKNVQNESNSFGGHGVWEIANRQ
jgi:hypothetical protein